MKIKSTKTTLIGIIGIVILIGAFVAIFLGKVTMGDLTKFLSPLALFLGAMGAWFSKDHDKD